MYFWTALLAFGAVAASVSGGPWQVLTVVVALTCVAAAAVLVPRRLRARAGG